MRTEGSRILVTGGAGFIGGHIVEALVLAGARVRVFDDFSSGSMENLSAVAQDVEILRGDVRDREAIRRAVEGCDAVSHQAAQLEITRAMSDPAADLSVNTEGTLNVLDAAVRAGVRKLVNASSACVYGQAVRIPESEDDHPTNPNWAYGVSKLAAEKYGRVFAELHRLSVVSLRYAIVYGEREWYGRALTLFLRRLFEGRSPVVFGEGTQLRDFTYVGDVVRLHGLVLESDGVSGEVFNASTGVATSIHELAELASEVSGTGLQPVREEVAQGSRSALADGRMRLPSELQAMVLDPSKAKSRLGWVPEVSLREGLGREWRWLGENVHRWKEMSY